MGINIGVNILHMMFEFYESLDKILCFSFQGEDFDRIGKQTASLSDRNGGHVSYLCRGRKSVDRAVELLVASTGKKFSFILNKINTQSVNFSLKFCSFEIMGWKVKIIEVYIGQFDVV